MAAALHAEPPLPWRRMVVSVAVHQERDDGAVQSRNCPSTVVGSFRPGPVPAPAVANQGMDTLPAPSAPTTGAGSNRAAAMSLSQGRQPRVRSWCTAKLGSTVQRPGGPGR